MHASDPSGRNLLGRKTPRRPGALQVPAPRSACASASSGNLRWMRRAGHVCRGEDETRESRASREGRRDAHATRRATGHAHARHTRRPRAPYTNEEQPSAAAPDAHELATHALASCATAPRPGTTAATGQLRRSRSRQRCCTTALTVTAETLAAATAAGAAAMASGGATWREPTAESVASGATPPLPLLLLSAAARPAAAVAADAAASHCRHKCSATTGSRGENRGKWK